MAKKQKTSLEGLGNPEDYSNVFTNKVIDIATMEGGKNLGTVRLFTSILLNEDIILGLSNRVIAATIVYPDKDINTELFKTRRIPDVAFNRLLKVIDTFSNNGFETGGWSYLVWYKGTGYAATITDEWGRLHFHEIPEEFK